MVYCKPLKRTGSGLKIAKTKECSKNEDFCALGVKAQVTNLQKQGFSSVLDS